MKRWVRSAARHAFASLTLAAFAVGAQAAPPASPAKSIWQTPPQPAAGRLAPLGGSGDLTPLADPAAFQAATAGQDLTLEDFSNGFVPPTAVRICFQAVSSASNDPCFKPGDLAPGFGVRSSRGSIFDSMARDIDIVVLGAGVLGTTGVVIGANVPGSDDPTRISFDPAVSAVAMDVYDGKAGQPVRVSAYNGKGVLVGEFEVPTGATNTPGFAAFTSVTPISQVALTATDSAGGTLFGNLTFGGGVGRLAFAPEPVNFGAVAVDGNCSVSKTLTNSGGIDLALGTIASPGAPFSISSDTCSGATLASGQSCTLDLGFAPPHALPYSATVTIPSSDPGQPAGSLELSGQGADARITALPGNVDFGTTVAGTPTGPNTVVLANLSAVNVSVASITGAAPPFAQAGGDCSSTPFALAPGTQCSLELTFSPASAGSFHADLMVESGSTTTTVGLYGDATDSTRGDQR